MDNIFGQKTNLSQPLPNYSIETLAVHARARPEPVTGARNTPIYQTTAHDFKDVDNAANPKSTDSLNLLSAIVSQFGNTTEVSELLEKAVQINPSNADLLNNLGQLYKGAGRFS